LGRLEEDGSDRKTQHADATGLLVFSRDGHLPVELMYRDRRQRPMLSRLNMHEVDTNSPRVGTRWTKALTLSFFTYRVHGCGA